jgi:hypothetical protein
MSSVTLTTALPQTITHLHANIRKEGRGMSKGKEGEYLRQWWEGRSIA